MTVERFTAKGLAEWGYQADGVPPPTLRRLVRQPVARVRVWAGSAERASDRADEAVDTALDLFRTAFHKFRSLIHDEQLLQRRTSGRAVKLLSEGRVVRQELSGGFGPHVRSLGLTLAGDLIDVVNNAGGRYAPLFDDTIPRPMAEHLIRALEWSGAAVTAERYDDKIVHLWTALESFLTGHRETKGGAAVSLRIMLLGELCGEGFPWPGEPYFFYGLRNDVVHGSGRGQYTKQDYLRLRGIVADATHQAITTLLAAPGPTSPREFISSLERGPHVQPCLRWLDANKHQLPQALVEYAKLRLAATSTRDAGA